MRSLVLALPLCSCAVPADAEPPPDCIGTEYAMTRDECSAELDAFAAQFDAPGLRECLSGLHLYMARDTQDIAETCIVQHAPEGVWGCYFPLETGYVVVIRRELGAADFWRTWDHELRHRASECVTGDWDFDHVGEFFNGH